MLIVAQFRFLRSQRKLLESRLTRNKRDLFTLLSKASETSTPASQQVSASPAIIGNIQHQPPRGLRRILNKKAMNSIAEVESSPALQDITLVILTHERHRYLQRALDYYQNWNTQIIVSDSSEDRYIYPLPTNVKYLHRPANTRIERIAEALKIVHTPLTLLAADDDFISPFGVTTAHKWLEQHKHCTCAQGWHGGFSQDSRKKVRWMRLHKFAQHYSVSDKSAEERIVAQARMYMNCIYALHRTPALRHYYCDVCPDLGTAIVDGRPDLLELGQAINSVSWGFHVVLPVFWIAREMIADSDGELCREKRLDTDNCLDLLFERLAISLQSFFHSRQAMEAFNAAKYAYRDFHRQWHQMQIPHIGSINEVLSSQNDKAVIANIREVINKHSFAV